MVPALLTVPPIELLLIVMPAVVGEVLPVAVMVPPTSLVTSPLTVEFWTLMQLIELPLELLTEAAGPT